MEMINGVIYKYVSPSNKIYIGQTIYEKERRKAFLRADRRYAGPKIENARKKYGPENFQYTIIFRVESTNKNEVREILNQKEKEFIQLFDSINNGYNLDEGGAYVDSQHTKPQSEETKKKRAESVQKYWETHERPKLSEESKQSIINKLSIPILQYTIQGDFVKEWKSCKEAGKILDIKPSLINKVCNKHNKCCREFIFFFKSEYPDIPKHIDTSYLGKLASDPNRYKDGKSRKVYQFELDGTLINTFNSVKEAAKLLGYAESTLGKYCRGKNNGIYKNYKFSYYE